MTTLFRAYWNTPHGEMRTVPLPLKQAIDWMNRKGGYVKKAIVSKKIKKNPRPRIGKSKSTRPSSATGKRASKRLIARRKRNGRNGYFPNPSRYTSDGLYLQIYSGVFRKWRTVESFATSKAHIAKIRSAAKALRAALPNTKIRVVRLRK